MKAQKRKLKRSHRILRGLYRTIVALSSIIVVLYIAMVIAIRPPDIAQAAVPNLPEAEEDNPLITQAGSKVRRDLCYTFLLAASDDGNGNADTIMIATYDVPNQKVGLVSIPRDTIVTTDRRVPKINSAYGHGIEKLKSEVSNLVGFPIDFYVEVDLEAFEKLVDAVGGVWFDVPVEMYYHDPTQDLTIHYTPGEQYLDGKQALEVVRFRQNADGTGYPDSDIGRTKTQQAMLKTLAGNILSWGSVTKVNQFVDIFATYVETDLSMGDMLYFATKAITLDLDGGLANATLPGDGTKKYKGYSWCYELYQEDSLEILNALVNPYTEPLTLDDVDFIRAS